METIRTRKQLKPRIYLIAFIIFFGGFITGIALAPSILGPNLMRFLKRRPPQAHEIAGDMIRRYRLNNSQAEKIKDIMERSFLTIENLRKSNFIQLKQELDLMKTNISRELNEEQKRIWEHDCKRLNGMLPPEPGKEPPPPPPPHK